MTPVPIAVPLAIPSTPVVYQLQGTGELDIKALTTTYDGSGAVSDFYPVMSIYTADDLLLSRTRVTDAIVAGAWGVVTFAPFLRKPTAVTPSAAGQSWALASTYAGNVAANTNTIMDYNPAGGGAFLTNDATAFDVRAIVGGPEQGIGILRSGLYVWSFSAQLFRTNNDVNTTFASMDVIGGTATGGDSSWQRQQPITRGYNVALALASGGFYVFLDVASSYTTAGGFPVAGRTHRVRHSAGGTCSTYAEVFVYRLGDAPASVLP